MWVASLRKHTACKGDRHLADNQHSLLCFVFFFLIVGGYSVTRCIHLCHHAFSAVMDCNFKLWTQTNPSLNCICLFFCHRAWKVTKHIKTTSFYQSKKTELWNQTNCYKVTRHILSLPPSFPDSLLPDHFIALCLFHVMPCVKKLKAMYSELITHHYRASSSKCRDIELCN